MEAFHLLARTEGILAALESSHAIAQAIKLARELPKDALVCATSPAAATRTCTPSPRREGITL
jgi:tryptophan synthase beta chain